MSSLPETYNDPWAISYTWNSKQPNVSKYGRSVYRFLIIIIIIIPLFTLGSIYSTNASGAEQMPGTNNSNQTKQG